MTDADLSRLRCLVLGGGGFIGTNLCMALAGRVGALRALCRRPVEIPGTEIVLGDFLNATDVARAVRDVDVVFHLVGTRLPADSTAAPHRDAQENILGSLQLLEACRVHGVKRMVFISSGGTVYGNAPRIPTPEDCPERPICGYGVSRLAIEKYLHLYEHTDGMTGIVLRVANAYGPFQRSLQRQQGVIGAFIARALAGQPIEIWGDGSTVRDYVYIDDVVDAFLKATVYAGPQRVFNIGSGTGTRLSEIVLAVERAMGTRLAVNQRPARSVDIPTSILDCRLAEKELGWRTRHDLAEGIAKAVDWHRNWNAT